MPIETNYIFWIIIAAVVLIFLLDEISEYLNIKSLVPTVPEEFKNVFDDEKYSQSIKYTKVTTKFGFIDSFFNVIVFLTFWLLLGFCCLDQIVTNLGLGPIVSGLIFFGILIFSSSILGLPFEIYETFKIEAEPSSPVCKTFLPMTVKICSIFSKAFLSPPTNIAIFPVVAL